MINWEYLAINFIKQAGHWNKEDDTNNHLQNCIDILKRLTTAHMVIFIELKDNNAAISYATSPYLQDVPVDEVKTQQLLDACENVFIKDITKDDEFFTTLFPALCSATFIPIHTPWQKGLLALGWSVRQDFDHSFGNFADVTQLRIKELLELAHLQEELQMAKKAT